ncbi:tubulin monoglutamylase TTLL4-like [Neodiprion virginianus]|uniref:tubulin monoglutamylase TTLL4-like n=1 Tax=Neodiprion virginianus TaxID=2961670 RepID=UPI001EE6AA84|nr:tubulin monoglutamylase TTLL4-like [Neodiprion virginianus]
MLYKSQSISIDGNTKSTVRRSRSAPVNRRTSIKKLLSNSENSLQDVGDFEVIDERNYFRSESRLICASRRTSKSLILVQRLTNEDSDQDDEFFANTEDGGYHQPLTIEPVVRSELKRTVAVAGRKKFKFPFRRSLFSHVPPYIFFHCDNCTCSPLPKSVSKHMKWRLNPCTPQIVRRIVEASGFRVVFCDPRDSDSWCGNWDHLFPKNHERLRWYQKVNHFPGTNKLGHKDQLWASISEMIKKFGKRHFGFMPLSFVLPRDKRRLMVTWKRNDGTKWIIKPPSSARGTGVHVVHQWWEVPVNSYLVVQRYLAKPRLIDGAKFDLRIYVLVTSFDPLRAYLYSDGLVRIATTKYDQDAKHHKNRFMHLTNTSVNKYSKAYQLSPNVNTATGHLWSLKSLWSLLERESVNVPKLWSEMKDIVVKTLIATDGAVGPIIQRTLTSRYTCFELFGFDILIEENCRPWLLEVNTAPSLHTDSAVHKAVKGPLIRTLLNIAGFQLNPRVPESVLKELSSRYDLAGSVCQNFHLSDKTLTHQATRKQFNYMYRNSRDEYLDTILQDLTSDDIRNLITFEDELTQLELFEKIFPTNQSHKYLKYFTKPKYYDMLLDAWEHRYGSCRTLGVRRLQDMCREKRHLMP